MEESPLIMANCSMKLNAEMSKADPEDGDREYLIGALK